MAIEKTEEPEEIFMVEPLEKDKVEPEPVPHARAPEVPAEPATAQMASPEAPLEFFSAPAEQPLASKQAMPALEPAREPDVVAAQPAPAELMIKPAVAEVMVRAEKQVSRPESAEEAIGEKSDDFTTDTLAELYIAQGFYEKAIDIYERMLVDNPNSRGLKDKLARVREMASASAGEAEKPATDLFSEPQVYSAQEETAEESAKPRFFAEPEKEQPASASAGATWQEPVKEAEPEVILSAPESKATQAKPLFTDFEPREYAPPKEDAELVAATVAPVEEKPHMAHATTKSPKAIRKDTIERLESWLKNIKKEN